MDSTSSVSNQNVDWNSILSALPYVGAVLSKVKVCWDAVNASAVYSFINQVKETLIRTRSLTALENLQCPNGCEEVMKKLNEILEQCKTSGSTTVRVQDICEQLEKEVCSGQLTGVTFNMILAAVPALLVSAKSWYSIYSYKIEKYESRLQRVRDYLNRAAETIANAIDTSDVTQRRQMLERTPGWIEDAKRILEDICDDLENEIRKVGKLKTANKINAVTNGVSLIVDIVSVAAMPAHLLTTAAKTMAGAAISIHAACTVGDIIANGKANDILDELRADLAHIHELEVERSKLQESLNAIVVS